MRESKGVLKDKFIFKFEFNSDCYSIHRIAHVWEFEDEKIQIFSILHNDIEKKMF